MPCNQPPQPYPCPGEVPCIDCTSTQDLAQICDTECKEKIRTGCIYYDGPDLVSENVLIQTYDELNKVIAELVKNINDVNIDLTFNSSTGQLCLIKNNNPIKCITIPDLDNQYLALDVPNKMLSIWRVSRVVGVADTMINEVDLSEVLIQTTFAATSSTLVITPGGPFGHTPTIEYQPSSDVGNILTLGSDNKPYAAFPIQGLSDVQIPDVECLSWNRTFANGILTLTPVFDWDCIAAKVCEMCNSSCPIPSNLIVEPI